jgi:hypothetical protein
MDRYNQYVDDKHGHEYPEQPAITSFFAQAPPVDASEKENEKVEEHFISALNDKIRRRFALLAEKDGLSFMQIASKSQKFGL